MENQKNDSLTSNEIYNKIVEQFGQLSMYNDRYHRLGFKSAAANARKAANEIRKLCANYRGTNWKEISSKNKSE